MGFIHEIIDSFLVERSMIFHRVFHSSSPIFYYQIIPVLAFHQGLGFHALVDLASGIAASCSGDARTSELTRNLSSVWCPRGVLL